VVMVTLYALLIPRYGALGAALATLAGFAVLAGSTWWVTQRIFPVRYEWGRLLGLLGLAVVLGLAGEILPMGLGTPACKIGVWLLYPLLLWQTGLISKVEKQYALASIRQLRQGLGRLTSPAPPCVPLGEGQK